ncbi:asparagine synthase (glutamine-hydrolyzing) [Tissierella sp. MB52-C2]|uniref:asparagine synthase (glutamine-hydrolyzing) n=1 Tax=Tissierella sp. MB52-C2 TaxID=3070999 RepID=UPI00280BE1A0|nr:asparagine synthase (glutamine-hydrolyzing) [Tissierella sp. MB52-C2]WMM23393.1 asparagine synthase (glutamine-hydrolyzing) [Tissierella sp. MB52-C2]
MCGFITLYKKNICNLDKEQCRISGNIIAHRGPDSTEEYIDNNIILQFKRLSIVDLENGTQPFNFKDKYIIVFNGEIYNYIDIREELIKEGYEFNTNSEVEVISSLYDKIGIEFAKKLRGMFAIIIYDKVEEKLIGVRDPFGIKPLYYLENEEELYACSEFKALLPMKEKFNYTPEKLNQYLTFQYIPGYETLFQGIKELAPSHIIEKKLGQKSVITRYYKVELKPKEHNKEDLKKEILETMRESVKRHMISDVPVATFLSSGIDSSIVTKLASELTPNLTAFSIGFDVEGYDETPYAERFCKEFGIKNTCVKLSYKDYIRDLPKIIYHMDSPIADPSAIPLYHICNIASKEFKVVLSGEGADEIFGGYNIYTEDESLKYFINLPSWIKSILLKISKAIPKHMKGKNFLERICTSLEDRYVGNARIFTEEEKKDLLFNYDESVNFKDVTGKLFQDVSHLDNVCKRQYIDINTWLVGDILTKADKMSMANSLEVRVPFLDLEVFNLAKTLYKDEKINKFTTKYMLREAAKEILPDYICSRKKLGYPVPIRVWLKNELYEWAYELISNNPVKEINTQVALYMLQCCKEDKGNYSRKVWTIIVYIIWYRLYIDKTLKPQDKFIL